MAVSDWQLMIYAANADSSAAIAYDDLSLTSIALNSGYTTTSFFIVKPEAHWQPESFTLADISGATFGKTEMRRAWNIESYPFQYNTGGIQDIAKIDTIVSVVKGKPFLWARVIGGSRKWPNTTNTAHPVVITDWSESVNSAAGTRRLNLTLQHRYRI